jgi:hypothetical protein
MAAAEFADTRRAEIFHLIEEIGHGPVGDQFCYILEAIGDTPMPTRSTQKPSSISTAIPSRRGWSGSFYSF